MRTKFFDNTCSAYSAASKDVAKFAFYPSYKLAECATGPTKNNDSMAFLGMAIGAGLFVLGLPWCLPTFVLALVPALLVAITAPFALAGALVADKVADCFSPSDNMA